MAAGELGGGPNSSVEADARMASAEKWRAAETVQKTRNFESPARGQEIRTKVERWCPRTV